MSKFNGFKIICPRCGSDNCNILISFNYELDGAKCINCGHQRGDYFD